MLRALLIGVSLVLIGCTSNAADGRREATTADPASTTAADAMLIEVSVGGGLAPPVVRIADSLPRVWVSGDGRYVRRPDPSDNSAIPALEERRISEAGLKSLLAQAADAGLLAESADFGSPSIYDAVNTRIIVMADGKRHEVLVRALGYPVSDLDPATVAARERVSRFLDTLQNPDTITGAGPAGSYSPSEVAVFVLGTGDAPAGSAAPTWPLGDLATAGTATDWPAPSARCLVVSGPDVEKLTAAATGATRATVWRSGTAYWALGIRPLLPDEHSCTV